MTKTTPTSTLPHHHPHRCPYWLGWVLASPVRRWLEDPDAPASLAASGDRVLELGPGMGFFTIALARRVGPNGQVYCVDVQPQMLSTLERRVQRLGLGERVVPRLCSDADLGVSDLTGTVDLAVLIHVLHEVDDPRRTLREVIATLRPNGRLLLIEPKGHVKPELFSAEVELAREFGMVSCTRPAALERYRGLIELMKR